MAYRIVTHDRKAHMDELLASALLSIHLGEEPAEILRIPSQEAAGMVGSGNYSEEDWFLDCGMVFHPEGRLFDHHQDSTLGSAALLVFESLFPLLQESELADYIRLVSRVDTGGLRVLDDYEAVSETQHYWSFSQKLLLKSFEKNPKMILTLFREGLEDKIRFERAKKRASEWLETEHHTEIRKIGGLTVLIYHAQPPAELASAIRAVDGKIVDENEVDAIYSHDERVPENRVFFRTNWGHDRVNFNLANPQNPVFCHQGGFLMKFIPRDENEWIKLMEESED